MTFDNVMRQVAQVSSPNQSISTMFAGFAQHLEDMLRHDTIEPLQNEIRTFANDLRTKSAGMLDAIIGSHGEPPETEALPEHPQGSYGGVIVNPPPPQPLPVEALGGTAPAGTEHRGDQNSVENPPDVAKGPGEADHYEASVPGAQNVTADTRQTMPMSGGSGDSTIMDSATTSATTSGTLISSGGSSSDTPQDSVTGGGWQQAKSKPQTFAAVSPPAPPVSSDSIASDDKEGRDVTSGGSSSA